MAICACGRGSAHPSQRFLLALEMFTYQFYPILFDIWYRSASRIKPSITNNHCWTSLRWLLIIFDHSLTGQSFIIMIMIPFIMVYHHCSQVVLQRAWLLGVGFPLRIQLHPGTSISQPRFSRYSTAEFTNKRTIINQGLTMLIVWWLFTNRNKWPAWKRNINHQSMTINNQQY